MFRLFADENFNGDIVRGLLLRQANLDIRRVQDVDLMGADDAGILAWAAENGRIILSHDRATLPVFAYDRVARAQDMPGAFIVPDSMPIGQAIREIILIVQCSQQAEWRDCVVYLPL